MRRTCLTIVYLVMIGLPLGRADEPGWKLAPDWVAPSVSTTIFDKNTNAFWTLSGRWPVLIVKQRSVIVGEVTRPAWPKLNSVQTVSYPKALIFPSAGSPKE